jgi:hypothetical protein
MALSSPPTLQALSVEAFWNRRDTSCSTFGHSAPSPLTEVRAGVSRVAALRSLQRNRTALLASWLISLTVIPAQAGI